MNQLKDAISQIKKWQSLGNKIVLVTGVFDLLHIEHIRFLKKAKASGDKLIVGLETDMRVKHIKGPNRPINNQAVRLEQVSALKSVDLVFLLPEKFDTPSAWENLINSLRPHIYAVSSHTSYLNNKKAIVEKFHCQLKIVHSHNPNISTSKLISQLFPSEF
jgi:rfaE bifunctional protein nucleotidyltransferase chain/domain